MKTQLFTVLIALMLFLSACVSQNNGAINNKSQNNTTLQEITIIARQFEFEPSVIKVKQGEHVKITITSKDVTHGFAIPEYGVQASIAPGTTAVVEFDATKKGTFTFACSVFCGSGHGDMKGMLIVE